VTMLAVYLVTLSAPAQQKAEDASADVRVTRELTFEPMTVHFAALGSFDDEARARIAAAEYADRGAAGVVYGGADGYSILGAGYALEADARRVAGQLQQQDIDTRVLTLSAPGFSMRVTAQESDADAIAEADKILRAQLNQLNVLALQVDRGEVSAISARTLAKVAAAELRSAQQGLEKISGSADQPVCAALMEMLRSLADNLSGVSGGGAVLSGQLRCCHADAAIKLIGFLNDPAG